MFVKLNDRSRWPCVLYFMIIFKYIQKLQGQVNF